MGTNICWVHQELFHVDEQHRVQCHKPTELQQNAGTVGPWLDFMIRGLLHHLKGSGPWIKVTSWTTAEAFLWWLELLQCKERMGFVSHLGCLDVSHVIPQQLCEFQLLVWSYPSFHLLKERKRTQNVYKMGTNICKGIAHWSRMFCLLWAFQTGPTASPVA